MGEFHLHLTGQGVDPTCATANGWPNRFSTLYLSKLGDDNHSFSTIRKVLAINATMAAWHCVWPSMGGN